MERDLPTDSEHIIKHLKKNQIKNMKSRKSRKNKVILFEVFNINLYIYDVV